MVIAAAGGLFTLAQAQTICHAGWRLPTAHEIASLVSKGTVAWTGSNEIDGRGTLTGASQRADDLNEGVFVSGSGFTVEGTFWPVTGYKSSTTAGIGNTAGAYYWTSDKQTPGTEHYIFFAGPTYYRGWLTHTNSSHLHAVRCVRDITP